MESPPKTFGTPPRKNRRHKANNYPYPNDWCATENPNINYLSPPRKRNKHNNYNTAPVNRSRRQCNNNNNNNNNITSSPISTRYQRRIGTSLYDNNNNNNNNIASPLRVGQKRKYLSSPISPTFEPICNQSPSRQRNNNQNNSDDKIDRYTPTHDNMNRYNLHSPTKRFLHNNNSTGAMMDYTNIIRPSPTKKRKLGQNYSNTNDDPNSLNHKIKQKLSQHTYNMVLQSELLGYSAQYTNANMDISAIQIDHNNDQNQDNDNNKEANDYECKVNENSIYNSPSLPNRRQHMTPNSNTNVKNKKNNVNHNNNQINNNNVSHHPLCPCYNNDNNNELHNNSPPDSEQMIHDMDNNNQNNMHNDYECVCDSITSNIATDFLLSPQRTLRYNMCEENEEYETENANNNNYNMTPIKQSSQSQLKCCMKSMRNIAKSPFKVLDAPRLTDDFYLNLVDWSNSANILSVGLGECVYLWSAHTSKVTKLVDLSEIEMENRNNNQNDEALNNESDAYDMVCSVGWSKNHQLKTTLSNQSKHCTLNNESAVDFLAVGSGNGNVFIFDTHKSSLYRSNLQQHNHRVGVISWKDNNILSTGSRDRNIYLRDIRQNHDIVTKLLYHKQEVCGLKWSDDSLYLASGGNDNKLVIWDIRYQNKPLCYGKHKAAVKAITWSPHESGLIASGGGTADRCIKFWNISNISANISSLSSSACTTILKPLQIVDTGSQVCNLLWSKNVNEIVSTHGYSLNQIVVWSYPNMDKIVTLTGHTYRVLYLACSPDGQTIVTGAGDETLRLWNIFPPPAQNNQNNPNHETFVPSTYSIELHIR